MKFDDLLVHLGEFGPYQKWLYFLLCIPAIGTGFHAVIAVFILGIPKHRCAIPGLPNDTYEIQNDFHQWLVNVTIPVKDSRSGSEYAKCEIYNITAWGPGFIHSNETIGCDRWVFDQSDFLITGTTQMSFVCDDLLKRSHITMAYMLGKLVGSLVFGVLGDIIGRKKVLCFSVLLLLISGVTTAFVPDFISFAVVRFFNGASTSGIFLNAFTIGMELVGPSKRKWTGMGIEFFFVIGEALLALVAYFVRDWHHLQLAMSVPVALLLVYWWIIPESPRWLLANGRKEEVKKILDKAARVNKVRLPANLLDDPMEEAPKARLWQLFTHRTLCIRTLVIFLNWVVVTMTYYGLSLNSGYLYGNIYLNFFLSVAVEFLGYLLCLPLLDRLGRKWLHCASMLLGGIACCCSIFTVLYLPYEYQWATTILAMVGKMGASAAFAVIYIFSSELFPTIIRNGGMGASSMIARVGGMIAPYIADLGKLIGGDMETALPLIVFGAASVTAGLAALVLPETLSRKLPDTIEDGIKFGNDGNIYPNFFLSIVVEFLGYLPCLPLLHRLGRKWLLCASVLLGGIACCCSVFTVLYLPYGVMVGQVGSSAAFVVICVFSSELFPTMVRNGGMDASSMITRVGGKTTPTELEVQGSFHSQNEKSEEGVDNPGYSKV
ncbi:organic cation transporter protein-like [Liolophura sinensis]|uniref:organic cation transporter protein-like n=1 Tax=Liolophura sinensis TaxID=3198878 RepID=UPI003157FE1B